MRSRFVRGVLFVLVAAVAIVAVGFIVMQLWNWLLPPLFGLKPLSFAQALGLLILSRLLFGGLRHRGRWHDHWRSRMRERWERMSPEEQDKFRAGLGRRCHGWRPEGEDTKAA